MATADFYIAKNDALPTISATLENADSTIVDLTGGTVQLLATNADTGVTTTVSGTNGGATGIVTATFPATTAGFFRCKWLVTFGGTSTESFPNNDYFLVQVYADPTGQIITNRDELNSIRAIMGLDPVDFTDDSIKGLTFLPAAELIIRRAVNKMSVDTNGAVPTVTQIMRGVSPATDDDKLSLKLAVAAYVAYRFQPGATNAVDVSYTKSVGPIEITRDRGGLGDSWKDVMALALADAGMYLSMITGWPDYTQSIFTLSGPTSSGARPDTLSGFWVR